MSLRLPNNRFFIEIMLRCTMSRNPAYGKWSEEETNWSQKDADAVKDILKEQTVPTSYEELLDEYESSLLTC